MRAAAILGLGCSPRNLEAFQQNNTIEWRIAMPSATDQADIVLLFGGDGTIHRHLDQLVKLGLPVLVIPVGSGNDFARALGLRSMQDSMAAWHQFCSGQGNVHAIDLGIITPAKVAADSPAHREHPGNSTLGARRYFASVAGVGLDGEVARRANHLPRWLRGHGGYALTLAPTLFSFAPFPMKIFAPDDAGGWTARSDQPTILAAFANTSTYGGGMKIAPQAKMDDGRLDVCVIGAVSPFKLAAMFPAVYFGRHLSIREVDYFRAPCVRVETRFPIDVYADGECVCQTPVEIGVERRAMQVIVHSSQTHPVVCS